MVKRLLLSAFIQVFFLALGIGISYFYAKGLSFSDFSSSLSLLQNMSAAVFTLTGIWIAYLYPEAINSFTNPKKLNILKGSENAKRIERLVLIIFTSAFVLIGLLLINITFPIMEEIITLKTQKDKMNTLYIGMIIYLALNQLRAISGIMINNLDFVYRLAYLKTNQDVSDDLNG